MKIHPTVPELWKNGPIYDLPSFLHFTRFAKSTNTRSPACETCCWD